MVTSVHSKQLRRRSLRQRSKEEWSRKDHLESRPLDRHKVDSSIIDFRANLHDRMTRENQFLRLNCVVRHWIYRESREVLSLLAETEFWTSPSSCIQSRVDLLARWNVAISILLWNKRKPMKSVCPISNNELGDIRDGSDFNWRQTPGHRSTNENSDWIDGILNFEVR